MLTLTWLAGIDRGRVGDVLVNGEKGAHILVAADIVQYLEDNLTQVRHIFLHTSSVTTCAVHRSCDSAIYTIGRPTSDHPESCYTPGSMPCR